MPFSNRKRPAASMSSCRASGTSMIGNPERLGVWAPIRSRHSSTSTVFRQRSARIASPRRVVDLEARQRGCKRGDRRRPRVEVGRRRRLQQALQLGRAREERSQRRVRLRETRDEHDVVVALVEVTHDPVAPLAVRAELVRRPLADHAEPVRVVDVEKRVVLAREASERRHVRGVPGHAVDAVDADQARRLAGLAQQALEVVHVFEGEPLDRRAVDPASSQPS